MLRRSQRNGVFISGEEGGGDAAFACFRRSIRENEFWGLAEEIERILVEDAVDVGWGVAAAAHFDSGFGNGERIADAPIAGAVEPDAVAAVHFENIDGAGGSAFRFRIQRDPGPETFFENERGGVFLDVIDDDAGGIDAGIGKEDVDDEAGAFEFVFEVGGVDEDQLVVASGEIDVLFEDLELVAGVFVETDFADAEDVGAVEELRNQGEDIVGEFEVFRFFRVDAEPAEVGEAEFGGAFRFVVGELGKVIEETVGGFPVVTGPESGFANGGATGGDHGEVIVGRAADHVAVWFDIAHDQDFGAGAPEAPWVSALGVGSVEVSLSCSRIRRARPG